MTFDYDNYQCVVGGRYFPSNSISFTFKDSDTKVEIKKKGTNLKYYDSDITSLTNLLGTPYANKAAVYDVLAEFANTETSDNYVYWMAGQSNMNGTGDPADLPAYLEGNIANCYFLNDSNEWEQLTAVNTHPSYVGPIAEFAYRMSQKYPTKTHYFVFEAEGGTTMYLDWRVASGTNYNNLVSKWGTALSLLENYESRGICWIQGESDANDLTRSLNYEHLERDFIQTLKAITGSSLFVSANVNSNIPIGTYAYREEVKAAKENNLSNLYTDYLIDPDSYELQGDNLHYTTDGYIDLGYAMSLYF